MPPPPTMARIASGELVEDGHLDFKQKVDLSSDRGKTKLVDDAVAFLNSGPGYLVIGVAEERGRFRHFEPIRDDPDRFARQLLSTVQDNIDPRPLKADVTTFKIDEGFVAILHLPWHGRRAFQNRITAGFLMRTGAKNTPLTRDEVRALFTPEETFERDAVALMEREDARCLQRRLMQENGPTFHLAVIPEERYQRDREPFDRGQGRLKVAPLFHHGHDIFRGCEDGHEAVEITFDEGRSITRLFIGSDWSLYAQVAHPFHDDHGRVTIHEFGQALPAYMAKLAELLDAEHLAGPFCVNMAVRNLRRKDKVAWCFPNADTLSIRPTVVTRIDEKALLDRFHQTIYRGSRYGG